MTRRYELKRRAERQEQTRQRIVEAAIELHATIGPARTTVSAIAERAGVQRHTYYRHFPDYRSLAMACSGLHLEREPLPDPAAWRTIDDPQQRLRRGLDELYAWFERNEGMMACVLRDAEVDPLTAEVSALRVGPTLAAMRTALAEGLDAHPALLDLALDFHAWRSLRRQSGLDHPGAVELMARALAGAARVPEAAPRDPRVRVAALTDAR